MLKIREDSLAFQKMNHSFTPKILGELESYFPGLGPTLFGLSPLLQYINRKTRSANRGSKARSSFANLYAIYVLVEDYATKGFVESGRYQEYEGADFSPLLARMRKLPFGAKLQNHALNNRANDEFHKYFPDDERRPILRDVATRKYWINETMLTVTIGKDIYNLAYAVLRIIDLYVVTKQSSFVQFLDDCRRLKEAGRNNAREAADFIREVLAPEKDARLFEIASYAILKAHFSTKVIFIGLTKDAVKETNLRLFKTGRTNANDGGIDFVMTPLGRFFQVTETLDVKKYFLDIDKIDKFPISFVIKTTLDIDAIRLRLEKGALNQYGVKKIVNKYMSAIEDLFNIPRLLEIFESLERRGKVPEILDEIIRWSRVEFNLDDELFRADDLAQADERTDR